MSNTQIVQNEPKNLERTRVEQRSFVKPPCDVYENVDEFLLVADVPGVSKGDVSIQMDNGEMIIEARRQQPQVQGKWLSTEYVACDYQRRFVLPDGVDVEKVSAELQDGVLRIHLPKSEAIKPRQIPIH
jgi:HSP20 family molecular chaperone IbpA